MIYVYFFLLVIAGASYGLNLILNIEQYDYMDGPTSDAGIKVCFTCHFHFANKVIQS